MSHLPYALLTARPGTAPTFDPLDHITDPLLLFYGEENWGVIEGPPDRIDTIESTGTYTETLTATSADQRPEVSTLNGKPTPLFKLSSNDAVRKQFGATYFPDDDIVLYTAVIIQREPVAANDFAFDFEGVFDLKVNSTGDDFRFRTKRTDTSLVSMNFGDSSTSDTLFIELWITAGGVMNAVINGGTPTTDSTNAFGLLCSGVDRMGFGNNTNSTSSFGGKIPMFLVNIGLPSVDDRLDLRNAAYAYYGFSGS